MGGSHGRSVAKCWDHGPALSILCSSSHRHSPRAIPAPSTRHGVMDLSVGDAVEHYRPADRTAATVSEYYPAMTETSLIEAFVSAAQRIGDPTLIDPTEFRNTAHPAIGPLTTQLRRNAFERMRALLSQPSARTRHYVAWLNEHRSVPSRSSWAPSAQAFTASP